jgi:predicted RNase H-like HicB family nuclease
MKTLSRAFSVTFIKFLISSSESISLGSLIYLYFLPIDLMVLFKLTAGLIWKIIYEKGDSMSFTAVFQKVKEGYIGFVEEVPGANTQGSTLKETRRNLKEAIRLVLETNKQLVEEEIAGKKVLREKLEISL